MIQLLIFKQIPFVVEKLYQKYFSECQTDSNCNRKNICVILKKKQKKEQFLARNFGRENFEIDFRG